MEIAATTGTNGLRGTNCPRETRAHWQDRTREDRLYENCPRETRAHWQDRPCKNCPRKNCPCESLDSVMEIGI